MAWCRQKPRDVARHGRAKAPWYLGWTDENGLARQEKSDARTQTEARRKAFEKEREARRIRDGEVDPPPAEMTFDALADEYERTIPESRHRTRGPAVSRLKKHLRPRFGKMALASITAGDIEVFLSEKDGELSPGSREHLRRQLRVMFNFAIRKRWLRLNPAAATPAIDVPEQEIRYLEAADIPRMIAFANERWRDLLATAVYTGLRKGELLGLRHDDIDLVRGLIHVRRCYDTPYTKGKKPRVVGIPDELVPFIRSALYRSRTSAFVFPGDDGQMRPEWTKLEQRLRETLARAGVCTHWEHSCRWPSCDFPTEKRDNDAKGPCPRCGRKLWVKGIPKPFVFHNLRSTFGTHAYEATDDIRFVQVSEGHSDSKITERRYSHVRHSRLVDQARKLKFGVESTDPALTRPRNLQPETSSGLRNPEEFSVDTDARDTGFEPVTFGSGEQRGLLVGDGNDSQPPASTGHQRSTDSLALAPLSPGLPGFTDPSLTRLTLIEGAGLGRLLTVAEVAGQLQLSRAMVYRLASKGQLASVRIGMSVRFREDDVTAFVAASRRGGS